MSNRYVVVPTVTVLAVMKGRLTGAVKGHALLKKKADALTMRFRQILKKIVQTKQDMGKNMRQSAFALTEAKYAAGDFRHTVLDGVETATVKVHAQQDNVAGTPTDSHHFRKHTHSACFAAKMLQAVFQVSSLFESPRHSACMSRCIQAMLMQF